MLPKWKSRRQWNRIVQTITHSQQPVRGMIDSKTGRIYFHGAIPAMPRRSRRDGRT